MGNLRQNSSDQRVVWDAVKRRALASLTGPQRQRVLWSWRQRYSEDQPRDWHGRWEGSGGTEGTSPEQPAPKASDLLDKTPVDINEVINSVPGSREMIAEARDKASRETHTDAPVSQGGHKMPDGRYTPERQALHNAMIQKILSPEAVARARPAAGERPTLSILGGRGGSGKSWLTGKGGVVDANNAILINNDDVNAAMPEFKGYNAAAVHEESSHITDMAEAAARGMGLNVILDATMRTPSSALKKIQAYKDAGYKVNGHYMYASPKTAATRALQRFVNGQKKTGQGRFVPPEYSASSVTNEEAFDRARPLMDEWSIHSNEGASPVLYARSKK
jgi:predicted ABC-type ATPase